MKCDVTIDLDKDILISKYFTRELNRLADLSVSTSDEIRGLVFMDLQFAGSIKEKQFIGSSDEVLRLINIWLIVNYGTKILLTEDYFSQLSFKVIT